MAGHLIDTLSHQPTLLHHFQQEWQLPDGKQQILPTLGLSVDLARVAATKQYLEGRGIPYALLAPDDPRVSQETERGYSVFWLVEGDVPPGVRGQMERAGKGIYAADLSDAVSISPYVQKLEAIPPLPSERLKSRLEQAQFALAREVITPSSHTPPPSPSPTPQQLQAQRTEEIAPTVKAYLDLTESHHYQGEKYVATWDEGSRTLSLVGDNQLKLLARQEGLRWQPLPIPLTEPSQPNLTDADVQHFQALAPRIEAKLEERRQDYRAWYESAKEQVMAGNGHHSLAEIERALALAVLAETGDSGDVARVLSQGDVLRQWRGELSEGEFQVRAREYLRGMCEIAVKEVKVKQVEPIEDLLR